MSEQLLKDAPSLSKNPLGIIALFIILTYGFASLLMGATISNLSDQQKTMFVVFLSAFPFAVLLAFYRLVTKHHEKMYSPADFKSDDSFLRTLPPEKQLQKAQEEARRLIEEDRKEAAKLIEKPAESVSAITPAPVEVPSRLADDVRLKRKGVFPARTVGDILLSETLLLKSLAADMGNEIRANVELRTSRGTIELDGIVMSPTRKIGVEIKFLRHKRMVERAFSAAVHHLQRAKRIDPSLDFLLCFIVDANASDFEEIARHINDQERPELIKEIKVVTFDALKRQFGLDVEVQE